MKFKKGNKLDKSKRSSYSLVAFKHCYSLETHLDLWRKKAIPGHLYFSKKIWDNSAMHLDFKKCFKVFLLNGIFSNMEFYFFDQLLC